MFRYSRSVDQTWHHQRWTSEPSTSAHPSSVDSVAGTTHYQKNRSSSTLGRDTSKPASKCSLSSTLQQFGNWARRSFRGSKGAASRPPKSLNDYVMTEVSSGVVVERKLPSRDQSPVTTSSGYASGADGVYARLHDDDVENHLRRGASRASRRYGRRASMHANTELPSHTDQPARPPLASAVTTDKNCRGIRLPVYENLLSEALGLKCETKVDSVLASQTQHQSSVVQRLDTVNTRRLDTDHTVTTTQRANISTDDCLVAGDHLSSFVSSHSSTLRRTGNKASPVYVNGNLVTTSRHSRSGSSTRDRTLTDDLTAVQQRLSFVSRSPSPSVDWDDRLSTLSLRCPAAQRAAPVCRDAGTQRARRRQQTSARRRLVFGDHGDQRREPVEEGVRPLYKNTGPQSTISNVPTRRPPDGKSTGLFPGLGGTEESVYETIGDVIERSGLAVSRKGPEVDCEHIYDNIDDVVVELADVPPALPPPPLPVRRPITDDKRLVCRDDVVQLDSHHVYTIADVLDSFEALAAHLPRAQRFIYDLQTAAYLDQTDRGRRTAGNAEQRWTSAAGKSRAADRNSKRRDVASLRRDDSQAIIVEDYVCSPGNCVRPHNTTAKTTHADRFYVPLKRDSTSNALRGGVRGFTAVESNLVEAQKQPSKKTSKESRHVSRSSTELDDINSRDRDRHRSSKPPPSITEASSSMLAHGDIARQHKALSLSLVDGISHHPSRPTSANFADRRRNSVVTPSTVADVCNSTLPPEKSRRPEGAPRSASEDRQPGTGNSSRGKLSTTVVNEASEQSSDGKSLQHQTSRLVAASSVYDRRRSSLLQWTAASCNGREIFC